MCGIFGFHSNDVTKTNWKEAISNFKILGLYNDTRGGDNVGMYVDGKIYKNAIFAERTFKTYIEKNQELFQFKKTEYPILLGHSRKGSVGGTSIENAHPFRIPVEGDVLVGVHNGTIKNWKNLLIKHNIDQEKEDIKVDSKAIFTILANNKGDYSVFEEYDGGGVFIWFYESNPSELFIFKGASLYNERSTVFNEERPLYFYISSTGIYYSSVKESLQAISSDYVLVKKVDYNKVFILKGADVIKEIEVKRTGIFISDTDSKVITINTTKDTNRYYKENQLCFDMNLIADPTPLYKINGVRANGIYIINPITGVIKYHFSEELVTLDILKLKLLNHKDCCPIFIVNNNIITSNYFSYIYILHLKNIYKNNTFEFNILASEYSLIPIFNTNKKWYFDATLMNGECKFLFNTYNVKNYFKSGVLQCHSLICNLDDYIKIDNTTTSYPLKLRDELLTLTYDAIYMFNDEKLKHINNVLNATSQKNEIELKNDMTIRQEENLIINTDLINNINFINKEKELLIIYNDLITKTREIIELSNDIESLKINTFKDHLSYHLNDWVFTTIQNCVSERYIPLESDVDKEGTKEYNKLKQNVKIKI
jgi:hypothetical protein